jgi:hypothetical protein
MTQLDTLQRQRLVAWFDKRNDRHYQVTGGEIEFIKDEYDDQVTLRFPVRMKYRTENGYNISRAQATKEEYLSIKECEDIINGDEKIGIASKTDYDYISLEDDTNIVVIEYLKKPGTWSSIKSMSVGKFYVARKLQGQYQLLTLNIWRDDGKVDNDIRVSADSRFREHEIQDWNDSNEIWLPVIQLPYNKTFSTVDIFTGEIVNLAKPAPKRKYMPDDDDDDEPIAIRESVKAKAKSFFNSDDEDNEEEDTPRKKSGRWRDDEDEEDYYDAIARRRENMRKYNDNGREETFIQMEQRIRDSHPKIKQHQTDLKCGLQSEILLLI